MLKPHPDLPRDPTCYRVGFVPPEVRAHQDLSGFVSVKTVVTQKGTLAEQPNPYRPVSYSSLAHRHD